MRVLNVTMLQLLMLRELVLEEQKIIRPVNNGGCAPSLLSESCHAKKSGHAG